MEIIKHPEEWIKFKEAHDRPGHYLFYYKPILSSSLGPIEASMGVKFICCNYGSYKQIPDNIENLSESDWDFLQSQFMDHVKEHACPTKEDNGNNKC